MSKMLRLFAGQVFRRALPMLTFNQNINRKNALPLISNQFLTNARRTNTTMFSISSFNHIFNGKAATATSNGNLLNVAENLQLQTTRNVTKFSLIKGKRKSVKAVLKRFKRLHWGGWIRTRCGRHKKMFKKSPALKRRLRQHIFTNATQSWLLDKMVTSFWRRPKYYIDDPYEPYHKRDEYFATKSKTFKV